MDTSFSSWQFHNSVTLQRDTRSKPVSDQNPGLKRPSLTHVIAQEGVLSDESKGPVPFDASSFFIPTSSPEPTWASFGDTWDTTTTGNNEKAPVSQSKQQMAEWQSQRYKKAMQRSRGAKLNKRSSVMTTTDFSESVPTISIESNFSPEPRPIIDTSIQSMKSVTGTMGNTGLNQSRSIHIQRDKANLSPPGIDKSIDTKNHRRSFMGNTDLNQSKSIQIQRDKANLSPPGIDKKNHRRSFKSSPQVIEDVRTALANLSTNSPTRTLTKDFDVKQSKDSLNQIVEDTTVRKQIVTKSPKKKLGSNSNVAIMGDAYPNMGVHIAVLNNVKSNQASDRYASNIGSKVNDVHHTGVITLAPKGFSHKSTHENCKNEFVLFLKELKKEVSRDHNELWNSFQSLFSNKGPVDHYPLCEDTDENDVKEGKKVGLTAEAQKNLEMVHQHLVSRSKNNNYCSDSQLVNDKRLRKERLKQLVQNNNTNSSACAPTTEVASMLEQDKTKSVIASSESQVQCLSGPEKNENVTSMKATPPRTNQQLTVKTSLKNDSEGDLARMPVSSQSTLPNKQVTPYRALSPDNITSSHPQDFNTPREHAHLSGSRTDFSESVAAVVPLNHPGHVLMPGRTIPTKTLPEVPKREVINTEKSVNGMKVNLRPPLPPTISLADKKNSSNNNSDKKGRRLSWLASLREKQKKKGRELVCPDPNRSVEDDDRSIMTTDLEQFSIQKVGINNVIALFGKRASTPLRRDSVSSTLSVDTTTPSPQNRTPTLRTSQMFSPRPNMDYPGSLRSPSPWLSRQFSRLNAGTSFDSSSPSYPSDGATTLSSPSTPPPFSCGDAIDLNNLPTKVFKSDESICRIPLKMKDDRRQVVIVGQNTLLAAACSSRGSSSYKTVSRESANVTWCAYRKTVTSITLNSEATGVVLSQSDGSTVELAFHDSSDCMTFTRAFYGIAASKPSKSEEDIDQDGDKRGTPKAKLQPNVDVTSIKMLTPDRKDVSSKLGESMKDSNTQEKGVDFASCYHLSSEEIQLVEKYRKMLKCHVSKEAIQHKMILENTSQCVIDAVLNENNVQLELPIQQDTTVASQAQLMSDAPSKDAISASALTKEEEILASKYRKMLQLSIPKEAVEHKMKMDQVDTKIVSAVLASWIPPSSIVDKANSVTAERNMSDSEHSNVLKLSAEETLLVETYKKMLKVGLTAETVRHRMTKEQVSSNVISAVLGPLNQEVTCEPGLTPEQEVIAAKYRTMLKMGVPKDGVRQKMLMESVDGVIILAVIPDNKKKTTSDSDPAHSKKSNLVSLHWTPLTADDLSSNSIWNFSTKKRKRNNFVMISESEDMSRLEVLFQKKTNVRNSTSRQSTSGSHNDGYDRQDMAKIIDLNRAQNVAISLKAFREFSFDELVSIIRDLDCDSKIQGERIQFMKDFLPTLTEEKAILAYTGDDNRLQPVELFFRRLLSVQRVSAKIAIIQTMYNFQHQVDEISSRFQLLTKVCNQVMSSEKLQLVLETILTIGNIMNHGSRSGHAVGFKFESLLKLTDTKSIDGKMTVLDYIVMTLIEKDQREVLEFGLEFPDCQVASRIAMTDVVSEVATLGKCMKECRTEMIKMKNEISSKPTTRSSAVGPKEVGDKRSALMASLSSRIQAVEESQTATSTVLDPRSALLSAIKTRGATRSSCSTDESTKSYSSEESIEKSAGLLRLEGFIRDKSPIMEDLEKRRNETIQCCKDLATYCGEKGDERVATNLLSILSEFTSNLQAAVTKYDKKKMEEAKKKETSQKKKEKEESNKSFAKNKNISITSQEQVNPTMTLVHELASVVQDNHMNNTKGKMNGIQNHSGGESSTGFQNEKRLDAKTNNVSKVLGRQDLLRSIIEKAAEKAGIMHNST